MKSRWITLACVTFCFVHVRAAALAVEQSAPVARQQRCMQYRPRSAEEAKAWQGQVRAKLESLLKIDDLIQARHSIPLKPKRISLVNRGPYQVEELDINSTPGRRIRIIVTTPNTQDGSCPAVLCIGGHGSSRNSPYSQDTVPKEDARARADRIYKGFGTALAEAGYVTISTLVSQHEIYEDGRLLMGERLWDLMCCVDYLESLSHVDKMRIGCAGLSLGGEMAMWLGAMDQRITATVSAGFLTCMDHMEQNHCMCWKFPGLRKLVDFADLYALTAPRALQCQNGIQEPQSQFYVPLARQALEEIRPIYRDMKRPENIVLDVHPGAHEIDLPALMYFCNKHLKGK
jgi:hypothetical protein